MDHLEVALDQETDSPLEFLQTLKEIIKTLPHSSGVYQYFDINGKILYIGKAKSLKNRVKSYFKFTPTLLPNDGLSPRIHKMISEVQNIQYIVVPSENDALILENSLIKQLKPKYNILLRDDKTYPYIYVNYEEDYPRPEITRKVVKSKNIKYFGPYSSGARDILDSLYDIFPLVQKKSCIKGKKACLFYQIKKCLAPCEGLVDKLTYKTMLDEAIKLINTKTKLIQHLEEIMLSYASDLKFEEAQIIKQRINTIKKSQINTGVDFASLENIDLFCVGTNSERGVVIKMFIRDGKLITSTSEYLKLNENSEESLDDIYKQAIIEYYGNNEILLIPDTILLAHTIENDEKSSLEDFIKYKLGKKVEISHPKAGKKKELCLIALENAKELLRIKQDNQQNTLLDEIKNLFELTKIPQRIEVFDNSHMQGSGTVGAMVVFDDEKWDKSSYRFYHLDAKDEYSQMKEMLTRRVSSFQTNPAPDLWVIDGGKALLDLAYDILDSVGVDIDIVAISKEKVDAKANRSKGQAKDKIYTKKELFSLLTTDKRLQFIQRLRDEAHRVAIGFHKKTKLKEDAQVSILKIKGIGEAKLKKLLNHFGSFEIIKNSSFEDIKVVLNEKDAILLREYFKDTE